ncbi:RNA polymerase factor sigma-54 [Thermoflavimicrobium dichotomicum]|uniref:RNA polymerase sigma-54 factor n=1 Tax=Thermoflavimicrobium dichotomicum TaxID=46223 RepID=A0A1I3JQG2_9BACL|nr:RNA polymerase factor sigma-54 [Thermoflavimicrobium dichotomicum]SFI62492.1 RNA polymerase sigma-54 factor [Thermoflavimicrobium dichotomicum]
MALQLSFDLVQEQRMKLMMTPELRQAIQLLQYSAPELEQYIQEQINENPLLEWTGSEDDEMWRKRAESWINYLNKGNIYGKTTPSSEKHDDFIERIASESDSLYEILLEQLGVMRLDPLVRKVCTYLIGNLDEKGYLDVDYQTACKRFQIDSSIWDTCLEVLHSLDPAGVGARSLAECLVIQLKRKPNPNQLAIEVAHRYLPDVAKGKLKKIAQELEVEVIEIQQAVDEIKKCNPRPGGGYSSRPSVMIYPDVVVEKKADDYCIYLNDPYYSGLRMNKDYIQLIRQAQLGKSATAYLKNWMQSAIWLMKGIEQRRETIYRVAEVIVNKQKRFFEEGVDHLQPLTLKQVGDELGLHESTISRATKHKYMQTPHGLFPFRFFFPSGLATDSGKDLSMKTVKNKIQMLIANEDKTKPLSDQKIAHLLQEKGIHISRRTVAKYREELGIPSSTARKRYND